MKNFIHLPLVALFVCQASFASEPLLVCYAKSDHAVVRIEETVTGIVQGSVAYNYSYAPLSCIFGTQTRIEKGKKFKCVGLWNFDWNETEELDTLANVEFERDSTGKWVASFTTNHVYGSNPITTECELD